MDINRFTEKMQDALRDAQSIAVRNGNQQFDIELDSHDNWYTASRILFDIV